MFSTPVFLRIKRKIHVCLQVRGTSHSSLYDRPLMQSTCSKIKCSIKCYNCVVWLVMVIAPFSHNNDGLGTENPNKVTKNRCELRFPIDKWNMHGRGHGSAWSIQLLNCAWESIYFFLESSKHQSIVIFLLCNINQCYGVAGDYKKSVLEMLCVCQRHGSL